LESKEKSLTLSVSFSFINESGAFAKMQKMGFFAGCAYIIIALIGLSYTSFWAIAPLVLLIVSFSALKELVDNKQALKLIIVSTVIFALGAVIIIAVGSVSMYMSFSGSFGKAMIINMFLPIILVASWGIPFILSFRGLTKSIVSSYLFYAGIAVVASGILEAMFGGGMGVNGYMLLTGFFLAYAFYAISESQLIQNKISEE